MTDHFKRIYAQHAAEYDALIRREDYQSNILPAFQGIMPLADKTVVEVGAGTGRLTRLLAPHVGRLLAFDGAPMMLATAADSLRPLASNWHVGVANNQYLPLADHFADIVIAGWSIGHKTGWYPDNWRAHVRAAVGSMLRVVKPGGAVIILETLGTGSETPQPPTEALAQYYQLLEDEFGFTRQWVRTDFKFASVEEGATLTRFFFGDGLADRVIAEQRMVLPECTGIWSR